MNTTQSSKGIHHHQVNTNNTTTNGPAAITTANDTLNSFYTITSILRPHALEYKPLLNQQYTEFILIDICTFLSSLFNSTNNNISCT
eukprot:UN05280